MGALTAWTYPLRGLWVLVTTPVLLRAVARFLLTVAGGSVLTMLVRHLCGFGNGHCARATGRAPRASAWSTAALRARGRQACGAQST
jgi:hypothetical protein